MLLYHGSQNIIKQPIHGLGKPYNDYGLGFYCTESKNLALEWAVEEDIDGYANSYTLNLDGLKVLNINKPPFTSLHWLSALLSHRTFDIDLPLAAKASEYIKSYFPVDVDAYDIIKGYRADDSYFMYAKDFINGSISYNQLRKALLLGDLGEQIVLKSKKAFERIVYFESEYADSSLWFLSKLDRDKKARENYRNLRLPDRLQGELFITRILEEEIDPNDPRIQ